MNLSYIISYDFVAFVSYCGCGKLLRYSKRFSSDSNNYDIFVAAILGHGCPQYPSHSFGMVLKNAVLNRKSSFAHFTVHTPKLSNRMIKTPNDVVGPRFFSHFCTLGYS